MAIYHEASRALQDRFDTRRLADRIDERLVRGFLDADDRAFPLYDGNGMYLSAGNALVNPHVGLLFIDFERRRRMRLNGIASVDDDDPLLAEYPASQLVVRVG